MDKRESTECNCIGLRLYGVVQGVGFRPFVAKLALEHSITGTVKNSGGCVEIVACGLSCQRSAFLEALFVHKPAHAQIVYCEQQELAYQEYPSFSILPSDNATGRVFLPTDLPACERCLFEMEDPNDRRFLNPFISCMSCGPRYSVIERVPYDRDTTTMRDFALCPQCESEYTSPSDRRFHAQTISCHDCGPTVYYKDGAGSITQRQQALDCAAEALLNGGIVAIKGIGGYHLACSPLDEQAVLRMRLLKQREHKPFAVLFENVEGIREYGIVSQKEEELLNATARPIVLLHKGKKQFAPSVCNKSRFIGAFLAYTPLQSMLISRCGPLVMTSANVSEDPIIKDDEAMFAWQSPYLNGVLYNDRRISIRLDDSVCKTTAGRTLILRRSRGYTPLPVVMKGDLKKDICVFAAGGHLKSAFLFADAPFATLCEHVGDLESEYNANAYADNYERIRELFAFSPSFAVCDAHPAYHSTAFAKSLGLPVLEVQHHHAHIAAVMAEHGLKDAIGVAFDGTGYGTDGAVWGGEFLVCSGNEYTRAAHLRYVVQLNGDEGMKDAKKSAMCHLYAAGLESDIDDERWNIIKPAIDNRINVHQSSSIGRLFDAVSAYLGVCQYSRFEAECAQELENLAAQAIEAGIAPVWMAFGISDENGMLQLDAKPLWETLHAQRFADKRALSLGFHQAVAEGVIDICQRLRHDTGITCVALSGGVFQNEVLFESTAEGLEQDGFTVYTNEAVPQNDGGIALGQAFVALYQQKGKPTCA